jgi:putative nucleotidyltransferase with HDIG domain
MKKAVFFRSRVFRRIFLVVLLCAFVPIGGLTIMTFYNAQSRLTADTARRLHHASKNIGMVIIAKLKDIEATLDQAAGRPALFTGKNLKESLPTGLPEGPFVSVLLMPADSAELQTRFSLSKKDHDRLRQGKPKIVLLDKTGTTELWMIKSVVDNQGQSATVAGQINPDLLMTFAEVFLPVDAQMSLVDTRMHPLLKSEFTPQVTMDMFQTQNDAQHQYAEINRDGSTWLVGNWSVFLRAQFDADSWHVLVSESKDEVFSSLYQFSRNAGMTGALTFWIILLASSVLVRRILSPLEKLKKATKQVGAGEYHCQVEISSQDEFEELSTSFNQMAGKILSHLQHQKKMGETISDFLGEIEQQEIIRKLFDGLDGLVQSEQVGFVLYSHIATPNSRLWQTTPQKGYSAEQSLHLQIDPFKLPLLQQDGEPYEFISADSCPQLLQPFVALGSRHFVLLPVRISHENQGVLIFAYAEPKLDPGESVVLRQLADQLSVALSKASVVEELDHLNFGILTALARSVDANSRWTRGHSERVTRYALAIAKEMGFAEAELLEVHRAGLLHDLGKISVPSEILNKPAELTEEEYAIVRQHPSAAARILEPIRVFDKIRPAVEQHHECWDGSGYPLGLKGEEIHPIARILAVADVYDALYSDRPYREGWGQERVFNYLMEGRHDQFDPKVVDALFRCIHKVEAIPAEWARALNVAI